MIENIVTAFGLITVVYLLLLVYSIKGGRKFYFLLPLDLLLGKEQYSKKEVEQYRIESIRSISFIALFVIGAVLNRLGNGLSKLDYIIIGVFIITWIVFAQYLRGKND